MKYENCKNCAYCEYHDEVVDGIEYKGFYCGGFDYLTDKARLENIEECEYAELFEDYERTGSCETSNIFTNRIGDE